MYIIKLPLIAQLVEQRPFKPVVPGSNPGGRTIMNKKETNWLLQEKYKGKETKEFFKDLEKLKKGYPLAYIISYVPFCNLRIFLETSPLIPRVETEYWVDILIKKLNTSNKKLKILDMCAGSGCIGLSMKKNVKEAEVDLQEIKVKHNKTIRKNAIINNISKIKIINGDLFQDITERYDYIIANPPYISKTSKQINRRVKDYEPSIALFANENGKEIIKRIIKNTPKFLKPNGILVIEHDENQKEEITKMAKKNEIKTYKDQFNKDRWSEITFNKSL